MKINLTVLFLMILSSMRSQEIVTVNVHGISPEVCNQMKANGDYLVWYYVEGTQRIKNNIYVEISNVGEKLFDKGYGTVAATPDANGIYSFNIACEAKKRKIDTTKPIQILVKMETSLGNEVFHIVERSFDKIGDPVVLDRYMWRANNEKIKPERRLSLVFSAFLIDQTLRQKALDHEGNTTFALKDFQLFMKQDEKADWKMLGEPLEGNITNGVSVQLSNKLPSWIDPSKKIYVRYSAKTPKGNFIWGEYAVEPHETRKEFRATGYSGIAFDATAPLK